MQSTRPRIEEVDSSLQPVSIEPPRVEAAVRSNVAANGTPLEIWEGVVKSIDEAAGTITADLEAKIGQMPRHTAEIELMWVTEQDKDLVVPGAVFYLTLFTRTSPSTENAQELRFRRRPAWNKARLAQVESDANLIASKMKPLPTAE